jgi:uncharacterized membrane protein
MEILLLAGAVLAVVGWLRMQANAAAIATLRDKLAELTARIYALEQRGLEVKPSAGTKPLPVESDPIPPPILVPPPVLTMTAASRPAVGVPLNPPVPAVLSSAGTKFVPMGSDGMPAVSAAHDSLETRIGTRWLLYIGIIAIVIGVAYFEKLAIDNRWINETARTIQGGVLGALLVYAGTRFVRAGYRTYGLMIAGGGIAVLYVSTYAAFNFYHLIPQPLAFALMSAITALAAWLADRQRSQGLALMAGGGGFATPFLLPGDTDAEIALFTYDAILIAGTMFLAHRQVWPLLNTVSYGFTALTVLGWAVRFYDSSKYLPTEFFLTLFCTMFLYVLREMRQSSSVAARLARAVLWTAPVGYYFASLAVLSPHGIAFLVFLVLLALVGAVAGRRIGAAARLICWVAVFVPLAFWLDVHAGLAWLAGGLAAVAGIYVINLLSDLERLLRDDAPVESSAIALLHVNGLASYGCAYLLIDAVNSAATAPVAALFALWHLAVGWAVARRRREAAFHFAGVAGTLSAIAIALQFHGAAAIAGWAAEGAVIAWLGLRERREWFRLGGVALFGLAIVRLFDVQAAQPSVAQTLLLNSKTLSGLFVVALAYLLAWLHDRRADLPARATQVGIALTAAKLLILSIVATEIVDHWRIHQGGFFEPWAGLVMAGMAMGSIIVWLGLRRRQEWIRAIGLVVVAWSALFLLPLQFMPAAGDYRVVLNTRAAAGVLTVALLYGVAQIHRQLGGHVPGVAAYVATFVTAASFFTTSLLTSEISAFWHVRDLASAPFISDVREGRFAREVSLSITWAIYATVLIVAGLRKRYAPIRYFGIVLFAVTIAKVFGFDMAELDRIYRVSSIVVLGVLLLATSYVYNRFRSQLTAGGS